eukprot:5686057-Pyramimonas_sp.AAC.1
MALSGLRVSWLVMAMKLLFALSASLISDDALHAPHSYRSGRECILWGVECILAVIGTRRPIRALAGPKGRAVGESGELDT